MAQEDHPMRPFTFKLAYWWSFVFAAVFLLYGAVTLVLGFLDRQYSNLSQPLGFLLIGILLLALTYSFRSRQGWAWYAEIVINGLIVIGALLGIVKYSGIEMMIGNVLLLVFSLVALAMLLSGTTKRYLFQGR